MPYFVQERTQDWQRRFGQLNLSCKVKELTGDSSAADAQEIDDADIICTTPEKFGMVLIDWIALNASLHGGARHAC